MAQAADRTGIVQIDRLTTQAAESMGREARRLHRHAERARALYRRRLGTWLQLRARLEHGPQRGAATHNGANGANGAPRRAGASGTGAAAPDAGDALHAEHETLVRELAQLQDRTKRLEVAARQLDLLVRYLQTSATTTAEPTLDTTDDSPAATSLRIIQAQEQERQRLAEEIHDGPAQVLTNAIFQVEYLDRVVASEPRASSTRTATTPQARAELALLRSMLRDGLEEVRGTIASLRPPAVDVGLGTALREAAAEFQARNAIAVRVDVDGIDSAAGPAGPGLRGGGGPGARGAGLAGHDPVEVLDLEDGIGQDLGRAVMDLLGQPLSFLLLGVDDPQRGGRRRVVGRVEGRLGCRRGRGLEVSDQQVELACRDLQALGAVLELGQLADERLVFGVQRVPGIGGRGSCA